LFVRRDGSVGLGQLDGACGSELALRFQRTDNRNIAAAPRPLPFRLSSRLRNPE